MLLVGTFLCCKDAGHDVTKYMFPQCLSTYFLSLLRLAGNVKSQSPLKNWIWIVTFWESFKLESPWAFTEAAKFGLLSDKAMWAGDVNPASFSLNQVSESQCHHYSASLSHVLGMSRLKLNCEVCLWNFKLLLETKLIFVLVYCPCCCIASVCLVLWKEIFVPLPSCQQSALLLQDKKCLRTKL